MQVETNKLPDEMWILILAFMEVKDIALIARVSKGMQSIATDNSLWFHFFKRDLLCQDIKIDSQIDYKQLYKTISNPFRVILDNKISIGPTNEISISCNEDGHAFSNFLYNTPIPAISQKSSLLYFKKDKEGNISVFVEFLEKKFVYVLKISLNKVGALDLRYVKDLKDLDNEKQNIEASSAAWLHQSSKDLLLHLSSQIDKLQNGSRLTWDTLFSNESNNQRIINNEIIRLQIPPSKSNCKTM